MTSARDDIMEDPPWKSLKLALERPYKDDNGIYVPVLLDIAPDGQQIYESCVRSSFY